MARVHGLTDPDGPLCRSHREKKTPEKGCGPVETRLKAAEDIAALCTGPVLLRRELLHQ
ncbi:hypothetical protein SGRIM128S_03973 [Streptomyces griseomycini]